MSFKYIMFDVTIGITTWKMPIIFPDKLAHKWVAESLIVMMRRTFPTGTIKIVNAGKVDELSCMSVSGDSETLNLQSNGYDASTINAYDYMHGIT